MMQMGKHARNVRIAAVLAGGLLLAACAQTKTDGLTGNVQPGTGQDFVVNVGDRVFFTNNQTSLSSQARATLDKQAQWLNSYSRYTVTIEGHADERGTRQYNIALGARRADSVRSYLVSRGISASRIKTVSYGKERPVAVCNDESCWSQNRRAVTVLNNAGS
ncbi:peptidoglycan-associated lipoprotein Pal [Stappia taiwanensis]|uniref:Peptidoglycan-associated lipoprotein n=1 Tax=Stappia taiwanensis TaxID=992267 RepID=A0A838XZL4_9HYPH|nr:peptidoglycan-associated lipoprotein Pal [Stappia taiwanensis]MBA4612283.1 peptidoglycan-associated lipoprotein Pal [Stappia taiwanensis]GGF04212.1 peptidoglycan-associated lipoprotein [Stappia taiwanensis]